MRSIIIANEYDYLDNATRWPASSRVAFRIKKCECRVENEHFYLGFTGVTFCDFNLFVPTPSLHKNDLLPSQLNGRTFRTETLVELMRIFHG